MRVAMLISRFPPHVGGTENQALRLARQLVKRGLNVEVITQRHDPALAAEEMVEGVRVLRTGAAGSTLWASFTFLLNGLRLLSTQKRKPDILHAHMIAAPAVLACVASLFFRKKTLVKVACSGPFGELSSAKKNVLGRLKLAFVLRLATHFVCVSTDIRRELSNEGIAENRMSLIPNGVDVSEFEPIRDLKQKKDLRSKLGLSDGIWILFSGRMTEQKRPLDLLRSFSDLITAVPQARMIFIGDGDQKDALVTEIQKRNLQSKVIVKPPQQDMRAYYQACDVFVLYSHAEGLSNSLLEAMATGLVCVGSRVGGTTDLIEHGRNGYLIGEEPNALTDNLKMAVRECEAGSHVGEYARKTVMERFEISSVAKKYQEIYAEILA